VVVPIQRIPTGEFLLEPALNVIPVAPVEAAEARSRHPKRQPLTSLQPRRIPSVSSPEIPATESQSESPVSPSESIQMPEPWCQTLSDRQLPIRKKPPLPNLNQRQHPITNNQ